MSLIDHLATGGASPGIIGGPTDLAEFRLFHEAPTSPVRSIDWRWRVGRFLVVMTSRPRRPWFDENVKRVVRFLERADRVGGLEDPRLTLDDPVLAQATAIRLDHDRRSRLALETLLLADQTDRAIAERLGLAEDLVATYHTVFFEVRPLLAHTDALLARAIGVGLYAAVPDVEASVKALALFLGPLAAEAALEYLGLLPQRQIVVENVTHFEDVRSYIQQYFLTRAIPITSRTAPVILALHARFEELARERADRSIASIMRPLFPSGSQALEKAEVVRHLQALSAPGSQVDSVTGAASHLIEDDLDSTWVSSESPDLDRAGESLRQAG